MLTSTWLNIPDCLSVQIYEYLCCITAYTRLLAMCSARGFLFGLRQDENIHPRSSVCSYHCIDNNTQNAHYFPAKIHTCRPFRSFSKYTLIVWRAMSMDIRGLMSSILWLILEPVSRSSAIYLATRPLFALCIYTSQVYPCQRSIPAYASKQEVIDSSYLTLSLKSSTLYPLLPVFCQSW